MRCLSIRVGVVVVLAMIGSCKDDSGGSGEKCNHRCSAAGDTECVDGQIRSCDVDDHQCRAWSAFTPCDDGFCSSEADCGTCANTCFTAGAVQCADRQIRSCQADANGCLSWSSGERCATGVCENNACMEVEVAWVSTAGQPDGGWEDLDDRSEDVAVFADGSAVIAGVCEGSVLFGRGEANEMLLNCGGYSDPFVAKYNADGTLAWVRMAHGASWEGAYHVAAYADGTVIVAGLYSDTMTFGQGEATETVLPAPEPTVTSSFLAAYGPEGAFLWVKSLGGTPTGFGSGSGPSVYGISAASGGAVYVAGTFNGTCILGVGESSETTLTSFGVEDIFLAKLDDRGTLLWAKRVGGEGFDEVGGIVTLPNGAVVLAGNFEGTTTFEAGESNEMTLTSVITPSYPWITEMFLAQFDDDGAFLWARKADGPSAPLQLARLSDNSVVLAAEHYGTIVFGAGEANQTSVVETGTILSYVAAYDVDGALLWAKPFGGRISYVSSLSNDAVYMIGSLGEGTTVFGEGEANETSLTVVGTARYVAQCSPSGSLNWIASVETGIPGVFGGLAAKRVVAFGERSAFLTGSFVGTIAFNLGQPNEIIRSAPLGSNAFLAKYAW